MSITEPDNPRDARLDRYWFAGYTVFVVLALIVAGLTGVFGPEKWFDSPSLRGLHSLIRVPWPVLGGIFLLDAVLIALPPIRGRNVRIAGWVLGIALSSLFAGLTVAFIIITRDFSNPFGSSLILLTPLVFASGGRGWAQRHRRA